MSDPQTEESFREKVQKIVECPICYTMPRTLPVASCNRGHLVCENCRANVHLCPLCRSSLYNNFTNAVAGSIIEIAVHKCRFQVFGCETQGSIQEIEMHEKNCSERTVHCPFVGCRNEIQMKTFETHAITNECGIPIGKQVYELVVSNYNFICSEETYEYVLSDKTILPYVLSRTYLHDGFAFNDTIFDRQINGDWRLLRFRKETVSFFVSLNYIGTHLEITKMFQKLKL